MTERQLDERISKWLEAEAPGQVPDRVLRATFERTRSSRQHFGWRAFLGRPEMIRFATALGSAAVLVVVAVVALNFFVNPSGIGGPPTASPSPSPSPSGPALLARGNFNTDGTAVELEATAEGSTVTGHLSVSIAASDGIYAFAVDLQCARMTEDGLTIIGGYTTEANSLGDAIAPVGSHAAIVLKPGSPAEATVWTQRGGPAYESSDCLEYLDEKLPFEIRVHPDGDWLTPIEGDVEFGPLSAASSPSPLLAVGGFTTVRGTVDLAAFGEGANVTGHMTVWATDGSSDEGSSFTVDLQCARTTPDSFIMIGGRTIATTGNGGGLSPVGTLAAIVLKRGSPVQATVWSQRGGGTEATSCLEYLDERFNEKILDSVVDDDDPNPIQGRVELGPAQ